MRFSGLAALTILAAAAVPQAAAAAPEYPWCAIYNMQGSATNCGFVTLEQCRWTISGVGGYCSENPFYVAALADRRQPTVPAKRRRAR